MHRPVLFNKTFTMKREDLFEGAIVLAKELDCKKKTRHEVVEIYETSVKLRSRMKYNRFFYASIEHLKPAKITRKALKECGFVEYGCLGCEIKCLHYKGTGIKLLLKDCYCEYKVGRVGNVLYSEDILQVEPSPWKSQPMKYMHEVQREIKKLGL